MCSYVQMDKSLEPEHWAMRATLPYSCPPCHFPEPCCWFWPLVLRFLVLSPCLSLNVLTPCPPCSLLCPHILLIIVLNPCLPLTILTPCPIILVLNICSPVPDPKVSVLTRYPPCSLSWPLSPWSCPDPLFSCSCPNTMLSLIFPHPLSWPHAPMLLVLSPSHTVLCPQPMSALFLSWHPFHPVLVLLFLFLFLVLTPILLFLFLNPLMCCSWCWSP